MFLCLVAYWIDLIPNITPNPIDSLYVLGLPLFLGPLFLGPLPQNFVINISAFLACALDTKRPRGHLLGVGHFSPTAICEIIVDVHILSVTF